MLLKWKRGLSGAQRSSGIQDETRTQKNRPLEVTFQTGAERRAAQIHCARPFGMDFTKRGLRGLGIQDETRSHNKLPLEITFQTGSVRRSANLLRRAIRNDFPLGMDFAKRAQDFKQNRVMIDEF